MAFPQSIVNQVTREELLSTDIVDAQTLASAQAQDILRNEARNDESRVNPNTPYVPAFSGDPIEYGADLMPTLLAAGAFSMTLYQGQAYLDLGTSPNLSGGDSAYQILRWETQSVSFSAPDPTNPRIDLIYAAPGQQQTDNQSRNILLDPVARTVAPAVVPKRVNPNASIIVVSGTPSGTPTAPALPSGNVPLYEVYIPAAAASSANFSPARQCQRRAVYPMSTVHAILQGMEFTTNLVNEATTTADLFVGAPSAGTGASKVIIDGEVIAFDAAATDGSSGPIPVITTDAGGNNPFAAPAPANNDKPYYLYACGGRHLRQGRTGLTNSALSFFPICIVESLVPPTKDGRPSSAITTPRGDTQAGALYVGIGFVVKNSTRRKPCNWAGDWVYALTGQLIGPGPGASITAGFNEPSRTLGAATTAQAINSAPAASTMADLAAYYNNSASATDSIFVGRAIAAIVRGDARLQTSGAASTDFDMKHWRARMPGVDVSGVASFASTTFQVWARGFNMNVKRLTAAI